MTPPKKYNKFLWYDTETTGLVPGINEITQLAGLIVINGVVMEEFNIKMCPEKWENVNDEALQIQRKTRLQLASYPDRKIGWEKFLRILDKYVDKYNREDKYVQCGQNVEFDKNFLIAEAARWKFDYLFSYLGSHVLDTYHLSTFAQLLGRLPTETRQLSVVAEYFGIEGVEGAHDALCDIKMTREVAKKLIDLITKGKV